MKRCWIIQRLHVLIAIRMTAHENLSWVLCQFVSNLLLGLCDWIADGIRSYSIHQCNLNPKSINNNDVIQRFCS